jgi:hypothetical protein
MEQRDWSMSHGGLTSRFSPPLASPPGQRRMSRNGFEQTVKDGILGGDQTVSGRFLTLWMRPRMNAKQTFKKQHKRTAAAQGRG